MGPLKEMGGSLAEWSFLKAEGDVSSRTGQTKGASRVRKRDRSHLSTVAFINRMFKHLKVSIAEELMFYVFALPMGPDA